MSKNVKVSFRRYRDQPDRNRGPRNALSPEVVFVGSTLCLFLLEILLCLPLEKGALSPLSCTGNRRHILSLWWRTRGLSCLVSDDGKAPTSGHSVAIGHSCHMCLLKNVSKSPSLERGTVLGKLGTYCAGALDVAVVLPRAWLLAEPPKCF